MRNVEDAYIPEIEEISKAMEDLAKLDRAAAVDNIKDSNFTSKELLKVRIE